MFRDFCCSCEFCCVAWVRLKPNWFVVIKTKLVCRCLCFATVRCGPCCVWGRRCRTHVASFSKCDTACPSYARLTLNCVLKHVKAVRQHPRTFGDGLLCQRNAKGLPLVCPLVGFEGACLCRLRLLKTHWQKGFALRGALLGALYGVRYGASSAPIPILWVCSPFIHQQQSSFNVHSAQTPMKNWTYIVASVLLTVCGNLGPHQSKVLCVTRDMHGKDTPFPSRPFLSSRTSACVNNTQGCCPHSSNKSVSAS